jgi:hypothetical protein
MIWNFDLYPANLTYREPVRKHYVVHFLQKSELKQQ